MLLSRAMFSAGTLRSCSARAALVAMVGRIERRSSSSGFGFFMRGPAYYWMSAEACEVAGGSGCRGQYGRLGSGGKCNFHRQDCTFHSVFCGFKGLIAGKPAPTGSACTGPCGSWLASDWALKVTLEPRSANSAKAQPHAHARWATPPPTPVPSSGHSRSPG
ncbi:hypothetical protein D3C85_1417080 [compost metagenome]